ncbi:MAG: 16S rRNA (guanine(527)-N(7))-methyltransferase RsmG [Clostridia bacterium]
MNDFINLTKNIGLNLDNDTLNKFEQLFDRLNSENQKYNLTTITSREDVFLLHFFDSVTSHFLIPENATLCDVGSGGGFPALPLKLVRPDINLTMIDSVNKKVNYLNETCALLNLSNAVAIHTRVEDFCKNGHREEFDVVTSRAVAKLPTLLEYCLPLVKVGGIFIAYKTDVAEELELSKNALSILGGSIEKVHDISIEGKSLLRTLVVFRKISNSPKIYPRGKNLERLSPL